MKTAVNLAYSIIKLHEENMELRFRLDEALEYKAKYEQLLDESLAYGQNMAGNMLTLIMKPGFNDAMQALRKGDNATN
jgi:hypothetical protein